MNPLSPEGAWGGEAHAVGLWAGTAITAGLHGRQRGGARLTQGEAGSVPSFLWEDSIQPATTRGRQWASAQRWVGVIKSLPFSLPKDTGSLLSTPSLPIALPLLWGQPFILSFLYTRLPSYLYYQLSPASHIYPSFLSSL